MFEFNNHHIFTGYLKQFLASFNLPACRIYTREFAEYVKQHGKEDPRVLTSFDAVSEERLAVRINYLKNNELYNYFWDTNGTKYWQHSSEIFYDSSKTAHGLTKSLKSQGGYYDTATHEYLGDYLRFLRDYHDINLMSMYNCFSNKIYNNVYFSFILNPSQENPAKQTKVIFDSQDNAYRIYAIPVKLFSEYTIAVDCNQGVEMFCGFYNTSLEVLSENAKKFARKTYMKVNKTLFNQPFLYDKLNIDHWPVENDFKVIPITSLKHKDIRTNTFTRWDIANREKDLKLFIKVPTSCRSSITILEGDYRRFNDYQYLPTKRATGDTNNYKTVWNYQQNHSVLNFMTNTAAPNAKNNTFGNIDLNNYKFKPISKLQLLALNTGASYPFADRLVEYLSGSAITPIDEIPDNIKRVQRVMEQHKNYFKIEGLWEPKMQNILYDYMTSSGPIEVIIVGDDEKDDPDNFGKIITKPSNYQYKTKQIMIDRRQGSHPRLGYVSKSTTYDILGYVDKDAEKWYASWKNENGVARVKDSIQNIDIYDGLYDI